MTWQLSIILFRNPHQSSKSSPKAYLFCCPASPEAFFQCALDKYHALLSIYSNGCHWCRYHGKWHCLGALPSWIHQTLCSLYATYDVREAYIYQTMGEVFLDSERNVGVPFQGMKVSVCSKKHHDNVLMILSPQQTDGIVLHGHQIDEYSSYLWRSELNLALQPLVWLSN